MNNEFKRMQKLAGLIIENTINEETKTITQMAGEVFNHFKNKDSSDSSERLDYIKNTYPDISDEDIEDVQMRVGDLMRDEYGEVEEGIDAYKKEKMSKSKLREKIREMILAELDGAAVEAEDYDPVAEAKKKVKDEEDIDVEDIDVEDIDVEEPGTEMGGGENAEVERIQDLLNQLQDEAEKLGDEKLLKQVGNTITFFTRQHIAEKPELNEVMDMDYLDRMEGSANIRDLNILKTKLRILTTEWMAKGFKKEDVIEYLSYFIDEII